MEKEITSFEKVFRIQGELKPIVKDSANPFFKSKYFDINKLLAELKPLLIKHRLILSQPLVVIDGKNTLQTLILDENREKPVMMSSFILPDLQDPQKMGACITYYRRFALQSLFSLEAEDDDGNTASGKTEEKGKVQGYVPSSIKKEIKLKQEAEFDEFMQTEIYKK